MATNIDRANSLEAFLSQLKKILADLPEKMDLPDGGAAEYGNPDDFAAVHSEYAAWETWNSVRRLIKENNL